MSCMCKFTDQFYILYFLHNFRSQSNRSLQTSQLLEETAGHKVETYGLPLPVLITEVLTTSDSMCN